MSMIREFLNTIEYAKSGRSSLGWDGLQMWINMKTKYNDDHDERNNWSSKILNEEYSAFRNLVLRELPEYDDSGNMNAANHFIIQCLRIPFKNKFTERRLIQVAYNIGQFKASEHEFPDEYVAKFYEMGLDDINTYI